jgi:6-pyruvoyltetrahydropterin/6-carboxytetrahydropterin synthase
MNKIRVTKKFSFDMAHALEGYNGLCRHIHGHTYHLRISLLGTVVEESEGGDEGFVLDFSVLKKIVDEKIIHVFDHSLVLKKGSNFQTLEVVGNARERVILTPFLPTCENLLVHFVGIVKESIPRHVELVAMRLDETPTSFAEWLMVDQL